MRRAQLIAESVAVICPYCGADQPAPNGSFFWIPEDFLNAPSTAECISCDKKMIVAKDSKAQFNS